MPDSNAQEEVIANVEGMQVIGARTLVSGASGQLM